MQGINKEKIEKYLKELKFIPVKISVENVEHFAPKKVPFIVKYDKFYSNFIEDFKMDEKEKNQINHNIFIHPIMLDEYRGRVTVKSVEIMELRSRKNEKKINPNADILIGLKLLAGLFIDDDGRIYQRIYKSISLNGIVRALIFLSQYDKETFKLFMNLATAFSFTYDEDSYPIPFGQALSHLKPSSLKHIIENMTSGVMDLYNADISVNEFLLYSTLKLMDETDIEYFSVFSTDPDEDKKRVNAFIEYFEEKLSKLKKSNGKGQESVVDIVNKFSQEKVNEIVSDIKNLQQEIKETDLEIKENKKKDDSSGETSGDSSGSDGVSDEDKDSKVERINKMFKGGIL